MKLLRNFSVEWKRINRKDRKEHKESWESKPLEFLHFVRVNNTNDFLLSNLCKISTPFHPL